MWRPWPADPNSFRPRSRGTRILQPRPVRLVVRRTQPVNDRPAPVGQGTGEHGGRTGPHRPRAVALRSWSRTSPCGRTTWSAATACAWRLEAPSRRAADREVRHMLDAGLHARAPNRGPRPADTDRLTLPRYTRRRVRLDGHPASRGRATTRPARMVSNAHSARHGTALEAARRWRSVEPLSHFC